MFTRKHRRKTKQASSSAEVLEVRELLTSIRIHTGALTIEGTAKADTVTIESKNDSIRVEVNSKSRTFKKSKVDRLVINTGSGNDRVANRTNLPMIANTGAGKDTIRGGAGRDRIIAGPGIDVVRSGNGRDYIQGGAGSDDIKSGNGDDTVFAGKGHDRVRLGQGNDIATGGIGQDSLKGQSGDDTILGGSGNDAITGDEGADRLTGGGGTDVLSGGDGHDTLLALDEAGTDHIITGGGLDTIWADYNGWQNDTFQTDGLDIVHQISSFANGADRSLDGDDIADPTPKSGLTQGDFSHRPLFSSQGPRLDDIRQGALADCYFLAGLGALTIDANYRIQNSMVDFGDGTFGVQLGGLYYRVDSDLPTNPQGQPAYAGLGAEGSLWVAIAEKAFAHYRRGEASYASIEYGALHEAAHAFGSYNTAETHFSHFYSASQLATAIRIGWYNLGALSVAILGEGKKKDAGGIFVTNHQYTVAGIELATDGSVSSIKLRNPWGTDGGSRVDGADDGYISVTPLELYGMDGILGWGQTW